ncbi:MAG: AsmA family protein [Pseudomonadota bacterium]
MFRKLGIAAIGLALIMGAIAFVVPAVIPAELIRQQVALQLSDLTGRGVRLRGDAPLTVFPNPSVRLNDIVIDGSVPGPDGALVVAEQLDGSLRWLPLLAGRIELSSFTLTRPEIRFVRDADGNPNWLLNGSAIFAALEPTPTRSGGLTLGTLDIIDGTVSYTDLRTERSETLTSANLSFAWPRSSTRASVSGQAIWRGEAFSINALIDQPAALAQPRSTSGVTVSLSSAPIEFNFEGTVTPGDSGSPTPTETAQPWQASGDLELASPSLRKASSWLGRDLGTGSTLGAFNLSSEINLVAPVADLTNLSLDLDGNEADGALTVDFEAGDRLALQGTLDFEQADLSPYIDAFRPTTTASAPGDWRFLTFPDIFSAGISADVRLASREVQAGDLSLGETAATLLLSEDRLVLGIGEASGYGGILRASLTVDVFEERTYPFDVRSELNVAVDDIELEPLLSDIQDSPDIAGQLTMAAAVEGGGRNLDALFQTAVGDIEIAVSEGSWRGVNIAVLVENLLLGQVPLGRLPRGTTEFETAVGRVTARAGRVQLTSLEINEQQMRLTMSGDADVRDQALDLAGALAIVGQNEEATNAVVSIPFEIVGSWAQPRFVPDLSALER